MKLAFGLFFLLVPAAFGSFASSNPRKPLILHSTQRAWMADDLKAYHQRMRKIHQNYVPTYPDALVITSISVGTPRTDYQVALETGSEATFLLGKDYAGRSADQPFFDPAQSSTAQAAGNYTAFTGDIEVNGAAFMDVLGFVDYGATRNTTQRFGVVNDVYDPYALDPVMPDGVLGLSWDPEDADNPNENSSAVVNLFAEIGGPRYWCHWLKVINDPVYGRYYNATTEFGSCLEDKCGPATPENTVDLLWIEGTRSLTFFVDAFTYNGKAHMSGLAKVDTGVPNILLLFDAFLAIYEDVQPDYEMDYNLYTVDCSKAGKLPDWVFTIGGRNYSIPSTEYVVDLQLPDGQCALSAFVDDSETTDYVFGYIFHNLWCIKMDVDNEAISILDVVPQATKKE